MNLPVHNDGSIQGTVAGLTSRVAGIENKMETLQSHLYGVNSKLDKLMLTLNGALRFDEKDLPMRLKGNQESQHESNRTGEVASARMNEDCAACLDSSSPGPLASFVSSKIHTAQNGHIQRSGHNEISSPSLTNTRKAKKENGASSDPDLLSAPIQRVRTPDNDRTLFSEQEEHCRQISGTSMGSTGRDVGGDRKTLSTGDSQRLEVNCQFSSTRCSRFAPLYASFCPFPLLHPCFSSPYHSAD
jgi:hypothetical protein